ncbi:Tetratricopeptide repeat-containing protein [Cyclobacterium xiamenense]|uniref:Tetratricopeptide repeat-containing protein n=1 Tax=Cyclobacterium xiamenense TaxID=1297121 RepID=A0A1H6Y3F8_9BACT|nr:tetratricopeptide repeat protein [Cyclobacterium xiamenense]SEJ31660.1 Tetratricopeptide repeat-containing protein [Cyclobacterium xiamenense]
MDHQPTRDNLYNAFISILTAFLLLSGLLACSSQKDTFTNRLYHNTTARFNAYYYAKEKIKELENKLAQEYQEDFSQVLPVFYPIDSSIIEANEELLVEAREMASKAVDWHKISKWVDPSYLLIGRVDYYQAKFDEAQNTFKYLNVNSAQDEVRHESLIRLLKSFIDLRQFEDANFVVDYLSKEPSISRENKKLLYTTLAYYYEARGETDMIVPSLFKALEFTDDKAEASRINFILGQMYQLAGLDAFAYEYYQKSLSGSPTYERTFFAQLYSQQVAELEKSKDLKRVGDYYDNLYADNKNVEFRDVILFEKGRFEKKQGNLDEAIRLYSKAAKQPGENDRQKGYIYEELSEVFLREKEDFLKTKYYLDSALAKFKETDRNYASLASRKVVFDQYAENYELLTRNDSLLRLSQLSAAEQEAYVDTYLAQEEERLIREAEEASEKKTTGIFDNLLAFGGSGGGSTSSFYWDNPAAIQRGSLEFSRTWGNRPLSDNWRSSNRGFQDNTDETSPSTAVEAEDLTETSSEASFATQLPDKSSLLSQIPNEPETRQKMLEETENAYFNLGKLLYFDLKRPETAIANLEKLIDEFPETPKKPEAYYTLYLASRDLNRNPERYAQLLNTEFPNSQFTKSVNNPEEVSGSQANFESAQNYKKAYAHYGEGEYAAARGIIRETLNRYPLSKHTDRLLLLDILVAGKLESVDQYKERLEGFLQNAQDEKLLEFAGNLLQAVSEGDASDVPEEQTAQMGAEDGSGEEAETAPSTPGDLSPYSENPSQTHIFILPMGEELAENVGNLTAELENFHTANFTNERLRTGTIALNRETKILIISPFPNAEKSLEYLDTFLNSFNNDSLPEEIKNSSFVISIENFQQLNKRKDLEEYRTFYEQAY